LLFRKKIIMKKCLLFLMVAAIAACNSGTNTNVSADTLPADTDTNTMHVQIPNMQCFESIKGNDTVYLKLERFPNVVTGNLVYNFQEKDGNTGTIDGMIKGDTLIADYTFISEGQQSVRQVAFLIKDSLATEGYADMKEEKSKMIFKNTASLNFSKGLQLKTIPCPAE
jgi:hypothetical protein